MSRGPLFLSAASGLASLAVSNPTALSDLTGGGVRIWHNSAAEVLQAAMGRTVAPPGCLKLCGCQDTRQRCGAAAGRQGPPWAKSASACRFQTVGPPGGRLKLGGCQDTGRAWEQLRASCGPPGPNRSALSDLYPVKLVKVR